MKKYSTVFSSSFVSVVVLLSKILEKKITGPGVSPAKMETVWIDTCVILSISLVAESPPSFL